MGTKGPKGAGATQTRSAAPTATAGGASGCGAIEDASCDLLNNALHVALDFAQKPEPAPEPVREAATDGKRGRPKGKSQKGPEDVPQEAESKTKELRERLAWHLQEESHCSVLRLQTIFAAATETLGRCKDLSSSAKIHAQGRLKGRFFKLCSVLRGVENLFRTAIEQESPLSHRIFVGTAFKEPALLCAPELSLPPALTLEATPEGTEREASKTERSEVTISTPSGSETQAAAPPQASDPPVLDQLDAPAPGKSLTVDVTGWESEMVGSLSAVQFLKFVQMFHSAAPGGCIDFQGFLSLITAAARHTASGTVVILPDSWVEKDVQQWAACFKGFDHLGLGIMDWRSALVSLLLWGDGNYSASTDLGPSLQDLCEVADAFAERAELPAEMPEEEATGDAPLLETSDSDILRFEEFLRIPLWFEFLRGPEDDLQPPLPTAKARAVKECLWRIFVPPGGLTLSIRSLLLHLCPEPQPVRGIQKAFSALDPDGVLTPALLHGMLHFHGLTRLISNISHATPCDPFSPQVIDSIFAETAASSAVPSVDTVGFPNLCGIHSGRIVANGSWMFRRAYWRV
eukprot:NODE_697_length_1849_cov_10.515000_g567_i0.p1 GENE.NODE_697_length_1849_cov_10.515000_g567_i0~~NODE_697_length_1849_cov_10.515000_g567_i0.p1  ORF type:complete len:593 (+),score=116.30 NODE_697_length_1849_cov_10.515000_g567_i0:60-1781(+)